ADDEAADAGRLGLLDLMAQDGWVAAGIAADQRQVLLGPRPGTAAEPDVVIREQGGRGRGGQGLPRCGRGPGGRRAGGDADADAACGQRAAQRQDTDPPGSTACHHPASSVATRRRERTGCRRKAKMLRRRVRDSNGIPTNPASSAPPTTAMSPWVTAAR